MHITKGDITFPKRIPNLNHSLFKGERILELINPKIKNINDTINAQNLRSLPLNIGHKNITKKTMKKTIPKLLLDPNFGFIFFLV